MTMSNALSMRSSVSGATGLSGNLNVRLQASITIVQACPKTRKNWLSSSNVEHALAGMDNQLFVSKYQLELPKKEEMERFLAKKV